MSSAARDPALVAGAGRSRARAGLARIHRGIHPEHRVLLLDSRRDGFAAGVEHDIVDVVRAAGMEIDLDAISDPRGVLRVLDEHPGALDDYDAVVAVAPIRADWLRSRAALTRVLRRMAARVPTLLVEHARDGLTGPAAGSARDGGLTTVLLSTTVDPAGAARQVGRALRGLLAEGSRLQAPTAPLLVQVPVEAARVRSGIGGSGVGRLERIVEIARTHFGLDAAEVNLFRDDLVVTVASAGASPRTLPTTDSLCTLALWNAGMTVLPDTWLDPDACRRPPTFDPDAVRFYAGCPIRSSAGEPVGVLCLWDHSPQRFDDAELAFLRDLALLAEGELIHA